MRVSHYKNNVPPLQWIVSNDPARAKGLKQVISFGVIHPIRIIVSSCKQKGFYDREVGVINGMDEVTGSSPVRSKIQGFKGLSTGLRDSLISHKGLVRMPTITTRRTLARLVRAGGLFIFGLVYCADRSCMQWVLQSASEGSSTYFERQEKVLLRVGYAPAGTSRARHNLRRSQRSAHAQKPSHMHLA